MTYVSRLYTLSDRENLTVTRHYTVAFRLKMIFCYGSKTWNFLIKMAWVMA